MKVLAINGSPKGNRSNTWKLTKRFLEGMAAGVRENAEAGPVGQNGERLLRELQVEALQINALEMCHMRYILAWGVSPVGIRLQGHAV